jgi:hypothetical protein
MRRYLPVILAILLFSCKNRPENRQSAAKPDTDSSFMSLVPEGEKFDSIVILYYKDDRYRFYTYYPTDSSALLQTLKLNLKTAKRTGSECPKEGTIYLYINGQIFNTLYFNTSPACRYLSFIFNGRLRRYEISEPLVSALQQLKPISIEPA